MNSYCKAPAYLGEAWGLRIDGPAPAPGQQVQVRKKDGTIKLETVGVVLWQGIAKNGKPGALCSIAPKSGYTPYKYGHGRAQKNRGPCGYPGCDGEHFCDECSE